MGHVVLGEQLLEAHAADAGHGVQAGQGQGGDAHGHEHGGHIDGHAEHLEEAGHAAAEDLEGGAGGGGAVSGGSGSGYAQGQDGQQALQHHSAVADLEHILFVFHGFGGGAGGDQAMEAGHGAAGHGDKQDGEHGAHLLVGEAGKYGQVHGGMGHQQAHHSAGDHADEHEGGHVIPGLLQQPHGQHGGEEDVDEGDVAPGGFRVDQGAVHTDGEGEDDTDDAQDGLLPAGEIQLFLHQAKGHGEHHEHDGDHTGGAVGLGGVRQLRHTVHHSVCIECTGDHIGEGGDDDAAEQPAEQQKQLAAQFADILFNQHTHRLAFVLDGGIQGAEIGNSTKEYAAQQHPQQNGQPSKGGSLDCAGNRAGACNG